MRGGEADAFADGAFDRAGDIGVVAQEPLGVFAALADALAVERVPRTGFLDDAGVELVGMEAGGEGLESGRHAARLAGSDGSPGVAQGYKTYFLQDDEGQMRQTHSVAAGLDYIGVSPILACLRESGRVRFEAATDREVLEAFRTLLRREGIIAALESSHAVAGAVREAGRMDRDQTVLVTLSGRGDKDIFTIAEALDDPGWRQFLERKTVR